MGLQQLDEGGQGGDLAEHEGDDPVQEIGLGALDARLQLGDVALNVGVQPGNVFLDLGAQPGNVFS